MFLEKKKNFLVDAAKGKIVLMLRRVDFNEWVEVEVKLELFGEEDRKEEMTESKLESEFGGEIEEMEFPKFSEDDKVVEGIEREMVMCEDNFSIKQSLR